MPSNHFRKFRPAFTLVEMLLYASLAGFLVLSISFFGVAIFNSWLKNQSVLEVEDQGQQVLKVISLQIQNADSLNYPLSGSSSSLSLVLPNPTTTIVFSLNSGKLQMQTGTTQPVFLTNNRVQASGLLFENLSRNGTPGNIRVSFNLGYNNPNFRQEFDYLKYFNTSISLR